jgi:acetyl-CoA carboxylase carboxyl transferase subunit beta
MQSSPAPHTIAARPDRSNAATSRVVASVVVIEEGKVLLIQEAHPHTRGKWTFPGGHVDLGETIEEAAIREAKEEAGYEVELDQPLPIQHESIERPVMHPFTAHVTGGAPHERTDDILDVQWFTPAEIRAMKSDLRQPNYVFGSLKALGL